MPPKTTLTKVDLLAGVKTIHQQWHDANSHFHALRNDDIIQQSGRWQQFKDEFNEVKDAMEKLSKLIK